jgi:hypothetical protein
MVQRQCRWLEYLKCKIKVITIVQYETIKYTFEERRIRQDFPPNEQTRMIIKLLRLWLKMQFNLKCRCMRQEQLSIRCLSCGILRCVGWQFLKDVSGQRYLSLLQDSSIPGKNLGHLDSWNRTKNLSRNVSNKLPISAEQYPRRAMNSTTARLKPEISHQHLPSIILSLVDG